MEGALPWETHPSIYEHVRAHLVPGEAGLSEGGNELPDEERVASGARIRFAPGAMDHSFGNFGADGAGDAQAAEALRLLRKCCETASTEARLVLYRWLLENPLLEWVDALSEVLRPDDPIVDARLHALARELASTSPDREPVKLGIVLMGLWDGPPEKDMLMTLGRHEEFTLYCVVALAAASRDPESDIWELAKVVKGWGRIDAVRRLVGATNPKVKDWLLREGCRCAVTSDDLAYICATTGDLRAALEAETIDDELMESSGEILDQLLDFRGGAILDGYADGADVVENHLRHLSHRAPATRQFLTVTSLKAWLSREDGPWKDAASTTWTGERRARVQAACGDILGRPAWRDQVLAELQSGDEAAFDAACSAARVLLLDTWDIRWKRLLDEPSKSGRWYHITGDCSEARIGQVVELARTSLPLSSMATGPSNEHGLGKDFEHNLSLSMILQALRRFPGEGADLVRVGLRSPVSMNRAGALHVLDAWSRGTWPEGMEAALRAAKDVEVDVKLKEWMANVLDGEKLELWKGSRRED